MHDLEKRNEVNYTRFENEEVGTINKGGIRGNG